MATIGNTAEASFGDGNLTYLNIDTLNKIIQIMNGAILEVYSDAGTTMIAQIGGAPSLGPQSATAVATGAAGTIATAGLAISRVSPAAARTGIILQAGTVTGQEVTVINEAVAANTLTFNTTPATSNVADSATEGNIPGLTARSFVWDSVTALWYRQN